MGVVWCGVVCEREREMQKGNRRVKGTIRKRKTSYCCTSLKPALSAANLLLLKIKESKRRQ